MGFITIFILQIRKQFQFAWASLVAQLVKNPLVMQETWVQSLGWEDPLEDMTTHSNILAWRISMDRGAWLATVHGVAESDITEQLSRASIYLINIFSTKSAPGSLLSTEDAAVNKAVMVPTLEDLNV